MAARPHDRKETAGTAKMKIRPLPRNHPQKMKKNGEKAVALVRRERGKEAERPLRRPLREKEKVPRYPMVAVVTAAALRMWFLNMT